MARVAFQVHTVSRYTHPMIRALPIPAALAQDMTPGVLATESLFPTLKIITDLPSQIGLAPLTGSDRLELQVVEHNEPVRKEFLQLRHLHPKHYIIVNGSKTVEEAHLEIITRVSQIVAIEYIARKKMGNLLLHPMKEANKKERSVARKSNNFSREKTRG